MWALVHCWWEYKSVQSLWKMVCRPLQKLKTEAPRKPANPLLSIHPSEVKAPSYRDTAPQCSCSVSHNRNKSSRNNNSWHGKNCPSTDEWAKTLWCVCVNIRNAIILRYKKGNHAIWENTDESWEHRTTWNVRDRQTPCDSTYMCKLRRSKREMDLQIQRPDWWRPGPESQGNKETLLQEWRRPGRRRIRSRELVCTLVITTANGTVLLPPLLLLLLSGFSHVWLRATP